MITLAVSMLTFQGASSAPTDGKNSAASQSPSFPEIPPPGSPSPKNCDIENDSACSKCGEFCPERTLLDTVSGFFGHDAADTDAANHWGVPSRARGDTTFVVAIVPDPVHTHLSLFFDRSIDAIGQAAQQAGYVFDRATMPWDYREHSESTDYRLRKGQENYEKVAEQLPGLMIFRPASPKTTTGASSSASPRPPLPNDDLFVFVVGETPTGGIHKEQFENALLRMEVIKNRLANTNTNKKKQEVKVKTDDEESLFILGPTFSGSLYSLKELLTHENTERFTSVFVHSGTVSSWETVDWLDHQQLENLHFLTFQESDRYALRRFIHFAAKQGYQPKNIAVLSEEETAYGNFEVAQRRERCDPEVQALQDCEKQGSCEKQRQSLQLCMALEQERDHEDEVVRLYFPRGISQLRSAFPARFGHGRKLRWLLPASAPFHAPLEPRRQRE